MNISLSIKNFILFFSLSISTINIIIFFLRELYPKVWWIGDQQFYLNTDSLLHFHALLFFLIYLFIITLISILILDQKNINYIFLRNIPIFFILISILLIVYSFVSFQYGVGVAASQTNTAGSWQIFFYLISLDGLFFAYALIEKNTKRLFIVSVLYSISNIFRGWAGFIINLILIYIIRNKISINIKKILLLCIFLIPIVFSLLFVREIFREGTGLVELYRLEEYSGIEYCLEILNFLLAKILLRFDFYSHYIGITTLKNLENMCYPFQENLYYTVLINTELVNKCTSLGSLIPPHLDEWYINKKTSFTVSSGFFGLPFDMMIIYFISNLGILSICLLTIRKFFNKYEIILFIIPIIFLLFLQGWHYQFIFIFIGFIIGLFLIKIFRTKKCAE